MGAEPQRGGAGRAAAERFGNGVAARRELDPASGLMRRLQVNVGLGTKLQDLTYAYDPGLRMASRADNLQVGPSGVRTETFTHDVLGRLTCSRFSDIPAGQAGATRAGPCVLAIGYAENGNIASKSDVGAYTYDPGHPHAVATAGASSFGYDGGRQPERAAGGVDHVHGVRSAQAHGRAGHRDAGRWVHVRRSWVVPRSSG